MAASPGGPRWPAGAAPIRSPRWATMTVCANRCATGSSARTPRPSPTRTQPVTGPADAGTHLTRKEALLHSNGDLSANHYDMNMVFFDVFLRYLRWTGDLDFAREIWPAFKRHLAWEQRLFRRTYGDLPLYEAYAAIWASDNLQYNGGGATHSSAYNVFAFRSAAVLARLLGEDPEPYEREAGLIAKGMEQHLWLPGQGAYAESKDWMTARTVYNNPAVWTVYHTIDSEVATARQAWQMIAERLNALRKVPVHGPGVPAGAWYMLSCSDWLPYIWSLNLLALAENAHTALAMWQAGMADEAFLLLKGNLLDSLFMGLAPGNFHMTSALDAHRQEAQRDSGDPIGITARALTEGLFGLQPDLVRGTLTIRPGFPAEWNQASIKHADIDFSWRREGSTGHLRDLEPPAQVRSIDARAAGQNHPPAEGVQRLRILRSGRRGSAGSSSSRCPPPLRGKSLSSGVAMRPRRFPPTEPTRPARHSRCLRV